MRYSGTERDDDDPWFRLGSLEVSTTVLVLLAWAVTLVVFTVEPVNKPVQEALALFTSDVRSGEAWRLVTWPWAHAEFRLGEIIDAALFWFFGTQLEKQLGRRFFTVLVGWSVVIIGAAAVFWSVLISGEALIADLRLLELTVVLLFIAEYPKIAFFFGIPAWVIGAVIVALEVVNDIAYGDWIQLLTVLLAALLIALLARSLGLLSAYTRVPELGKPGFLRREKKPNPPAGPSPSTGRRSGPSTSPSPDGRRSGPLWGKRKEEEPAEIVPMPQQRRRPVPVTPMPDVSADDLALDALLDKITDGGLDALTPQERQELDDLRSRRRSQGGNRPPA